jgi:cell fate regulator YaaT (PSP1 superfamily)
MGCSSCGTKTGDTSPGCKNNGTCGTSGCNKLNVYNWLSDMQLPAGARTFNIVEVRFKGSRKDFFRNAENITLREGDVVAVEGNPGHDIGVVSMAGELVRLQLKKKGIDENSSELKALYRLAKPADIEKWDAVRALEVNTMYKARTIAGALRLRMKLSDVEYQGDGKKATFFYTAEERVDFRELIKKLADEFKVRVEMRQIGMRQEASRLGGIGSCGRELCCSTWLTDFKAVSTGAARYQNLSLNPLKLAGQCGKLKCCLNYELDSYMDALKDIPDSGVKLETEKGYALHRKTDIFKRMMWFAFIDQSLPRGPGEAPPADNWVALKVDRVKEIMEMNKQQLKPAELIEQEDDIPEEKPLDYADVVGQDSLTRMMDKKKKKKGKGKGRSGSSGDRPQQATGSQQQSRPQHSRPQQNRPQQERSGQSGRTPQPNRPQQQNRPPQQGQNKPQQGQRPQQGESRQQAPRQHQPSQTSSPQTPTPTPPATPAPLQNPSEQNSRRQRQKPGENSGTSA